MQDNRGRQARRNFGIGPLPATRPDNVSPVNGESQIPPLIYRGGIQGDVSQIASYTPEAVLSDQKTAQLMEDRARAANPPKVGYDLGKYKSGSPMRFVITLTPTLILPASGQVRTFLYMQTAFSNPQFVDIFLDNVDPNSIFLALIGGGSALFDDWVPQNDVYAALNTAATGNNILVVTFATDSRIPGA